VQRNNIVVYPAASLLLDINIAHANILLMGFFHAIKVEFSVIVNKGFYNLCGKKTLIVEGVIAEKELDFCKGFNNNKHATINH